MKFRNKLIVMCILISTSVLSVPVGSRFSYQGQLEFNNVPLQGVYDLKFGVWSDIIGGSIFGNAIILEDVAVDKGLFSVELDFGDSPFTGDDVFLNIELRAGNSTGSFTFLSPRQRVNATPYAVQADFLAANGATTGQVLKFNGTDWVAGTDNAGSPYWGENFGGVQYVGDVIIGDLVASAGDTLQILSQVDESPLRILVGGAGTRFRVSKNGGTGIGANYSDGQIPDNGLRVAGTVQLSGAADASSAYSLVVSSPTGTHPLATSVNGILALQVADNGGVRIGNGQVGVFPPPASGLVVAGETELTSKTTVKDDLVVNGDAKHGSTASYGFVKAGIEFSCGFSGTTRKNYFNNINTDEITVRNGLQFGTCVVELPFSYQNLYFQTQIEPQSGAIIAGGCNKGTTGGGVTEVVVCSLYDVKNNTNTILANRVTLLMF